MKCTLVGLVSLAALCCPVSTALADDLDLYSIHTASFVYHAFAPKDRYEQYFKNELIAVERRMNSTSDYSLYAGTMINSEGDRCVLLGVDKKWAQYNKWDVEGIYLYAGEFFFKSFSHCGDSGAYHDIKKATGVGFAPYIYHGVKYNVNRYVGLRAGFILPVITVLSVQINF
ncbi:hypothetical protein CYR55_13470 [Chimaeribacter californicus]|uniref:DUF3575 domain-containing protein n=1 Tax=Chimaeribacter californicus TaxID=2060067 RepID=A0A2N5E3K5_9GAMM|nr:hypothetical protein [Chimaeribacter californicus]PLR35421.1 hypothetical protein CYR55_13470 [Chimaeribacter californicus]